MFRYTLNLMLSVVSLSILLVGCNDDILSSGDPSDQFITLEVKNIKRYELPIAGVSTRAANPDLEKIDNLYALFFESKGDKKFLAYKKAINTGDKTFEIPIPKMDNSDNVDIAVVTNMDEDVLKGIPEVSNYSNVISSLSFDAYAHNENKGYPYWGVIPNTTLEKNKITSVSLVRSLASFKIDASALSKPLTDVYITNQAKFANVGFEVEDGDKPVLPNPYETDVSGYFQFDTQIDGNKTINAIPLVESAELGSFVFMKLGNSYFRFTLPYSIKRNHRYHFIIKETLGAGYSSIEEAYEANDNANVQIITWDDDVVLGVTALDKYLGFKDTKFVFPREKDGFRWVVKPKQRLYVQTNVDRFMTIFDDFVMKSVNIDGNGNVTKVNSTTNLDASTMRNHFEAIQYYLEGPEGEEQFIELQKKTTNNHHGGSGINFNYTGKLIVQLSMAHVTYIDVFYNPI